MASALDKSIISRLVTGLQATPAVKREMVETLGKLLRASAAPRDRGGGRKTASKMAGIGAAPCGDSPAIGDSRVALSQDRL